MSRLAKFCCCCCRKPKTVETEAEKQAHAEKQPLLPKSQAHHLGKPKQAEVGFSNPGAMADNAEQTTTPEIHEEPEQQKASDEDSGKWEEKMYHTLLQTGVIKSAAIVDATGTVKVANFSVNQQGVDDVIKAFNGDVTAIAENGVRVSDNLPMYVPGKMDKGKAIYAMAVQADGSSASGGCLILKSTETVIIVVYEDENVSAATRLAREVMDRIEELGH